MKKTKKAVYAPKDFDEACLPHNRRQQLKFIFKTRRPLFLLIGLVLFAFALPLLISWLLCDFNISNAYNLYEAAELTEPEFFNFYFTNTLIFTAIGIPFFMVFAIGLAGAFGIFKNLLFGKPVFFKHDFIKGIKNNWKSFILTSFVIGVFTALLALLLKMVGPSLWFFVYGAIFLLFITPFLVNIYYYKSVYNAGIGLTIKNSVQFLIITNIKSILLVLGLILIPAVSNLLAMLLIITPMINEFINVAFFIFLLPWLLMIVYSYYYSVFDEKINKLNYPNYYLIGLYNQQIVEDKSDENKVQE
ncbi:MAG: hypothetical protein MJ248_04140 [Bacilli bacterium]|nr:hypothetical protein [Bacilli bacterium]